MPKSNRKPKKIYLDYAASVLPNPSSIHELGVNTKKRLENVRDKVASVFGARSEEIIFTSGGTESNNLAIQGVIWAWHENNSEKILPHIITTNIEHPSVLETCKILEKRKLAEVTIVPVEVSGIIDPKKIKKEIRKNTVLISVMYANNEIGTIQPIREIAKEIRYYKKMRKVSFSNGLAGIGTRRSEDLRKNLLSSFSFPVFHTDAVQAVNYLDLNVGKLGVDLLSLSGSKIEGAGRVGVLYKKKTIKLVKIFGGGDQEQGLRPGTENLKEILKFSSALKSLQNIKAKEVKRLIKLRDYFITKILSFFSSEEFRLAVRSEKKEKASKLIINGDLQNRLPNNVNITFPKIPSDLLVLELSAKGIMASSKSACKSSDAEGSYVIKAIRQIQGKTLYDEIGGVRFSLGRQTTKRDIDYTVKVLTQILTKLKKWY